MICALWLALAPFANADVPNVVTLSATLEEQGVPVSRTVAAGFVLWDAPVAGSPVWSEDAGAIDVQAGVLVVELGARADRPLPPAVFAQPLWLEIVVDGETLAPRVRLAAVPYALAAAHADDASTVDGLAAADLVKKADLETPGAARVSWQNIVDAPAAGAPAPDVPTPDGSMVAIYLHSQWCVGPGAIDVVSTCFTRHCNGSQFFDCTGVCTTVPTTVGCPSTLLGWLRAP